VDKTKTMLARLYVGYLPQLSAKGASNKGLRDVSIVNALGE
jgi:hypothetical protein